MDFFIKTLKENRDAKDEIVARIEATEEKVTMAFKAKVATRAIEEEANKALSKVKKEVKFWKAKVHPIMAKVEAIKAWVVEKVKVTKAERRKELVEESESC